MKKLFSALVVTLAASAAMSAAVYEVAPAKFNRAPVKAEAPASRASSQEVEFSYAVMPDGTPHSAIGIGMAKVAYSVALEFSEDNTEIFDGDEVTAFVAYSGFNNLLSLNKYVNQVIDIEVWFADDLGETPFYTQKASLTSEGYARNVITLTTPVKIQKGKPFYAGYTATTIDAQDYVIPTDDTPTNDERGGWAAFYDETLGRMSWDNLASDFGTICNGLMIKGENMPENQFMPTDMQVPPRAEQNKPSEFYIKALSRSVNDINSLEISYQVDGGAVETKTVEMPAGLNVQMGQEIMVRVSGVVYKESRENANASTVTAWISKVNGVENVYANNKLSGSVIVIPEGKTYPANVLVEEFTGTWCQFCPGGIVAIEKIKAKYPDNVIIAAGHYNDEMTCRSYDTTVRAAYANGYPWFIFNRDRETSTGVSTPDAIVEDLDAYVTYPAFAQIEVKAEFSADGNSILASADVEFAYDFTNNDNYRVGYIVTEDRVGPYDQENGYAGGRYGACGGWESKPAKTPWVYDEVVRASESYPGVRNSLPRQIVAGQKIAVEATRLSLKDVTDKSRINVIGIISRVNDREVLNSDIMTSAELAAGVEDLVADSAKATAVAAEGAISIVGDFESASVYNVAGVKVAEFAGESVAVPAGLYIVSIDGRAVKVVVK